MSFDPTTAPHLKPWLVRTLEPICDAEPGALADYILALLKHNAPENDMRKELISQLDEFLEKECAPFIDTLFTVLRTKSYLPYGVNMSPSSYSPSSTPPVDSGIPIPLDVLMSPSIPDSPERTRKRSIENDDLDGRPATKGMRLSARGKFSRYSNGRDVGPDSRSTGGWGARVDRHERQGLIGQGIPMNHANIMGDLMGNMNGHPNGGIPQNYRPPDLKRGICRDYHNNGYCARGAYCKYNHGDDAVVPGQLFQAGPAMSGPLPFLPIFPNESVPFAMNATAAGSAYDPHESRMDMRPRAGGVGPAARLPSRAPILPRMQREDGSQHSIHASGELPVIQDLTPQMDGSLRSDVSNGLSATQNEGAITNVVNPMNMQAPLQVPIAVPMDVDSVSSSMNGHGSFRGGARGGRSRGSFGGAASSLRPERKNDKTLVVEKIPEDKLSLDAVNGWFKRFGTVTNVAVDATNAKALVSFSTHGEAHAAWKCEDAVFGNRFVKLFWHRPMEGHGQVGARMLAASAPLVANISNKKAASPVATAVQPVLAVPPVASTSATPRKASTSSSTSVSALAAKQRLLEQQIAEQKRLMGLLETASPDEKKQLMYRLRQLGEEMKPSSSSSSPPVAEKPLPSTPQPEHREIKEKERLDKELELHNATAAVGGEVEESTENLKAKLEKLKAEAASLGISDTMEPTFGGSHRPYRGRGRGMRGYHRGTTRGGARGSMKLDNRPKKLLVKGVSDDGIQAIRDWYGSTGQMESVDTIAGGDVVVTFVTRSAAEQGLSKGTNIPPIGHVQLSWFTGQLSDSTPPKTTSVSDKSTEDKTQSHSPHMQEEEVVASGWGGGGDDGDGMGML